MGCCGRSHASTPRAIATAAAGLSGPVTFEYTGGGALTLYGRMTGIRYHFPGPGARVAVDPRDAPVFEIIDGLAVVSSRPVFT